MAVVRPPQEGRRLATNSIGTSRPVAPLGGTPGSVGPASGGECGRGLDAEYGRAIRAALAGNLPEPWLPNPLGRYARARR